MSHSRLRSDKFCIYFFIIKGGFTNVTKDRKWSKIATFMGYPQGKSIGTMLKTHYERLLYPYEVFSEGKSLKSLVSCRFIPNERRYFILFIYFHRKRN